jgi:hypothetical protein
MMSQFNQVKYPNNRDGFQPGFSKFSSKLVMFKLESRGFGGYPNFKKHMDLA